MVTAISEEKALPQERVVVKAPEIKVPADTQEKAQHLIDNYVAFLTERTEAYMHRMAEAKPEAADPTLIGGYQYWNCLTAGPYQFPPILGDYRPSKVVAAGEWTLMLGVIWINPVHGPGGSLPGTIALGDRGYRVRFEAMNLSTVTDGPDSPLGPPFTGTFASPAPVVSVFPWWHLWADPGPNPNLYEVNFTADITTGGQPFAAFSTWHFDPDTEPPFMMVPPRGPHWQFEIPARFLVYRK